MNTVHTPIFDLSFVAAADLSAAQHKFVKLATGGKVDVAGAGDPCVGILQDKPLSGKAGAVRILGTSKLSCDGASAIAVGDPLKSNASGIGIKAATDKDKAGAIALEAVAAGTAVIAVLLCRYDIAV